MTAPKIELGARLNIETTGSDKVESQIKNLENRLEALGADGDKATKVMLMQMIEMAKVGRELVGTLERIGNTKITFDGSGLASLQNGVQNAVAAGVSAGLKQTLSAGQAAKILTTANSPAQRVQLTQGAPGSTDLTASINRLEATISSFAVTMAKMSQGSNIKGQIESLTGRPQFGSFQEINEVAIRQEGKAINAAANEIVAMLGQAEQVIEDKKKDVRAIVKSLKQKIDLESLNRTISSADLGETTGSASADMINSELFSSISKKLNIELLGDVDQLFQVFDQGFDKMAKDGKEGTSLLRDSQGKWLSETEAGQKMLARLAVQFYQSVDRGVPADINIAKVTSRPDQSGPFNVQSDFLDAAGTSDQAAELRETYALVQKLFTTYEQIEETKQSIAQVDRNGKDISQNNMQRLERMLAMNRDQLALAKEHNSVSVRYNTILQQNDTLMSRGLDELGAALVTDDYAKIAELQREYDSQIQKSTNLQKQLQTLIERNRNLQQGAQGSLNAELRESISLYSKLGPALDNVSRQVKVKDASSVAAGNTPQFAGFTAGIQQSSANLDSILGSGDLAQSVLGSGFTPELAIALKKAMGVAVEQAASDPALSAKLGAAMSDLSSKIFELASASQGVEGIDAETSASLLEMAEDFKKVGSRVQETTASLQHYTEGLEKAEQSQIAVRDSSASVDEVLKRIRSQFRIGDEGAKIIERIQRQSQRTSAEVEQTLSESESVMRSLNKPLALFDRQTITNAKSFLETMKSTSRAAETNVEAVREARRLSLRDVEQQATVAKAGNSETIFAGLSGAELDAKIAQTKAQYNTYYDNLEAKAQSSAQTIRDVFERTNKEIGSAVSFGNAYAVIEDSLPRVQQKVASLADQFKVLSSESKSNSSTLLMNASDMKQLVQDSASLSREIRKLTSDEKVLRQEMVALNAEGAGGVGIDVNKLAEVSAKIVKIGADLAELKKKEEELNKIRFSPQYIGDQQKSTTLGKNRETAERLTSSVDPGDIRSQMQGIAAAARSMDLDAIAKSINDFKALKGVLSSTFSEADKGIRSYDALIARGVKLDETDRRYMATLRQVKGETSALISEMQKQEASMKSAESRVKANTQTFDDYAVTVYSGVKSQVDFAIGAGALTGVVASMGMAFRELLTEARMLSRTLTVLQSDILNMEQVSKIAYQTTRELAVQYGMTVGQVADVAKELGSAGMKLEEVNRAWEDTLRAINATNAETTQVTRAVAGIYNVYRQELKEAGQEANEVGVITDTLTSIFRNHQAEMDEIVQGYKFVVGTGKTAGFTFQQMGGYLSVLNDNMIKSGMAGRGLQTVFAQTAAKTGELARMFNIKLDPGKTIASQFNSLLEQMNEKIGGVEVSARDMNKIFQIFDREGARAFTTLVQQYPSVKKALHETEFAAAGVTAEMNLLVNQSLDRRFYQMKQSILDVARNGFDELQPGMISVLDSLKGLAKMITNFNSALGGVPIKLISIVVAMTALTTVGRTLLALLVGFKNVNLAGGAAGLANYFLSASKSGQVLGQELMRINTLKQEQIALTAELAAADKAAAMAARANAASGITGVTKNAAGAPAVANGSAIAAKRQQLEQLNATLAGTENSISRTIFSMKGLEAALSSAISIAAPLLLMTVMFKLAEAIGEVQNASVKLKEGIDKSVSQAARLNNELYRLRDSESTINKLSDSINKGFIDTALGGKKMREIIDGLGADAQKEFIDLAGMSDEQMGGDYVNILNRLNQYRLKTEKDLQTKLKKEQSDALSQQMAEMKMSMVSISDMYGSGKSLAQDMINIELAGVAEISKKRREGHADLMDYAKEALAVSKAGLVIIGAKTGSGISSMMPEELRRNTAMAAAGQDPKKVNDAKKAFISVLSSEKKIKEELLLIDKKSAELQKWKDYQAKNGADAKMVDTGRGMPVTIDAEMNIIKQEIEASRKSLAILESSPEKKQIFDETISRLKEIRGKQIQLGQSAKDVDKQYRLMFEDMFKGAPDAVELVENAMNRLKQAFYSSIIIPEVLSADTYASTTLEVEKLRAAFNWQGSTAGFKALSDDALVMQDNLKKSREEMELFLLVQSGLATEQDMALYNNITPAALEEYDASSRSVPMSPKDYMSIANQAASMIANQQTQEGLNALLRENGLYIPFEFDVEKATQKQRDDLTDSIRRQLDVMLTDGKAIEANVNVNVDAIRMGKLVKQAASGTDDPTKATGTIRRFVSMAVSSSRNTKTGNEMIAINEKINKGIVDNAYRLAEINGLWRKQNDLAGIINKRISGVNTTVGSLKNNQMVRATLSKDELKLLDNQNTSHKDKIKLLDTIQMRMKAINGLFGDLGLSDDEQRKKIAETEKEIAAQKAADAALLKDEIAKNREIKIQLELEKNALVEKIGLLGQSLIFVTEGYAFAARTADLESRKLDDTVRELMVQRQLLGISAKQGAKINSIADLYDAIANSSEKTFRSSKESVAGVTKLIEVQMSLLAKQRKIQEEFANENKLLIETIGVTESVIQGEDTVYGKATKQIYDMLSRLPEINMIEQKIAYVKQNQIDMQANLNESSAEYQSIQKESESQIIQLLAKKAKLLSDMQKAQKELNKLKKEELIDDKRPELYQAASEALNQYQQPFEKETESRLKSAFDKNELETAMGIQNTTGDPLLFILNNREEAMKRFMVMAKEGQVDFSALSSTIQNTLEPQIKAYKEMLAYEQKLKDSYVTRAKKVGGNLTESIKQGNFSAANSQFGSLQSTILDLTKKTGNEMLTVKASEKLIEINSLMLEAEQYQKNMIEIQLNLVNLNIEHLGSLFVTEARKIQAELLKSQGADWADVEAALNGELGSRTESSESAYLNTMNRFSEQIDQMNYILSRFSDRVGVDATKFATESKIWADKLKAGREVEKSAEVLKPKLSLKTDAEVEAALKRDSLKFKIDANEAERAKVAEKIGALTKDLVDWADGIKDTRVQVDAYNQALHIITTDASKASEVIQKLGGSILDAKKKANPLWYAITGLGDAFLEVGSLVFSLVDGLGNIDYAVSNAETFVSYLQAIREATESYIGSVNETTTALQRNESSYYDYINGIQDAEKARYEQLMAAEKTYRESLVTTEQVFKDNFLKPLKDMVAGGLSSGASSAASSLGSTLTGGLNQIAFGATGLNIAGSIGAAPATPELKAAEKNVEQNKEIISIGIDSLKRVEDMIEVMKNPPKANVGAISAAGVVGAKAGDLRAAEDRSGALRFGGNVLEGLASSFMSVAGTMVMGALSGFGSIISQAFDATISGQTTHLMKFVEKFAKEIPQMVTKFTESFTEFFPKLVDTLVGDVLPNLVEGLVESLPTLVATIAETFIQNLAPFVFTLVDGIKQVAGPLLKEVVKAVVNLVPVLTEIIPALAEIVPAAVMAGVGVIMNNLPQIIFATLMAAISIALLPIELIMGAVRAIVSFFGGNIEGFSILKYIAQATKGGLKGINSVFHDGGVVPGVGEKNATLLGGEGVLNLKAMSILGREGVDQLNSGKAAMSNSYASPGARSSTTMTRPSSLREEGRSGPSSTSTVNMNGLVINAPGADRRAIEELPEKLVIELERRMGKRQSNRSSRLNPSG